MDRAQTNQADLTTVGSIMYQKGMAVIMVFHESPENRAFTGHVFTRPEFERILAGSQGVLQLVEQGKE